MFGVCEELCWCVSGYNTAVTFVLMNCMLNLLFVNGDEMEEEEFGINNDDFDVETASDDEIKTRLKEFGVHYSLESVLKVLEPEAHNDETVKILLAKFYEEKLKTPQFIPPPNFRHPIISIDGFFTHGRTKVAKIVASAMHGRRMLLPTRHLARLRNYIKSPQLKKHYYSLSKYTGANMATLHCRTAPVILERYWHDQVSYVIARTFTSGLVPENSSVFDFPKDLLVPDLMFFVNGALNPKVHNESTATEHVNNELAGRIADTFRRIRPKPIEIGPPGLPPPLAKKIIAVVDKIKHRFLPKPSQKPNWKNH